MANPRQQISPLFDDKLKIKLFEILSFTIDFFNKHNLRWFACGGTMLGAVRHNDIIPWDDDIDLILPAPDFDRFVEIWEKEADKERYSLCIQTKEYNDHTLTGSVRDNNTTFITDSTVDLDVNQGLAIDILPLHACPKSVIGQKRQLILAAACSLFKAGRLPARQSGFVTKVARLLLGIFRTSTSRYSIWSCLEKKATKQDRKYDDAKYVREFTMFPFITWLYPKKWFDGAEWVKFEDTEVPIPVGAKEYLTKRYGDYMQLPKEENRHPEHRVVFMDLDTPYICYKGIKYFAKGD